MHRRAPPDTRQKGPLTPAQQRERAKRRRSPAVLDTLSEGSRVKIPDGTPKSSTTKSFTSIKTYAPTVTSKDLPNTAAKRRTRFFEKETQGGGVVLRVPVPDHAGLVRVLGYGGHLREADSENAKAVARVVGEILGKWVVTELAEITRRHGKDWDGWECPNGTDELKLHR